MKNTKSIIYIIALIYTLLVVGCEVDPKKDDSGGTKTGSGTVPVETPKVTLSYGDISATERATEIMERKRFTVKAKYTHIAPYLLPASRLTTLTFTTAGSMLTHIGKRAFFDNEIGTVTFPNKLIHIGEQAFARNRLTDVTIPASVKYIGKQAFRKQKGDALTTITFAPKSELTYIGYAAFKEAKKVTGVTLPSKLEYIGEEAFDSTAITAITIPASVVTIAADAFEKAKLATITFAGATDGTSKLERIGPYAFGSQKSDTNLTTNIGITIPSSVRIIDNHAFESDVGKENQIATLTFGSNAHPSKLRVIGQRAFQYNLLTTVTIPESVQQIGSSAFQGNPLTDVKILGDDVIMDASDGGPFIGNTALDKVYLSEALFNKYSKVELDSIFKAGVTYCKLNKEDLADCTTTLTKP